MISCNHDRRIQVKYCFAMLDCKQPKLNDQRLHPSWPFVQFPVGYIHHQLISVQWGDGEGNYYDRNLPHCACDKIEYQGFFNKNDMSCYWQAERTWILKIKGILQFICQFKINHKKILMYEINLIIISFSTLKPSRIRGKSSSADF